MVKPKKIDMGMTPAFTLVEDAKKATEEWGRTDLYSTGDPVMDEYLGNSMFGGYGRCISGTSKIQCRRKGSKSSNNLMSIENIYRTVKSIPGKNIRGLGDKFEVLAVDPQTEKMVWADIEDIFDNGEKECLKVTVKNKYGRVETLTCTKEHALYCPGKKFVPLEHLKVGDKVCMKPKGKEQSSVRLDRECNSRYLTYEIHTKSGVRYRDFLHRLVYTAHKNNVTLEELMYKISIDEPLSWTIPEWYDVHHKNEDRLDNRIENLELMTNAEHSMMHAKKNDLRCRKSWVEGEIVSIEPAGVQHVYDMRTSLRSYNAEGIIVHNCSAYEIITIFGDTGMNKSTFCTSMILEPAAKGTTVAYFALEDDPKDVVARIMKQVPDEEKLNNILQNVLFMPENDGYTLDMMADAIEEIFGIADIVVVDPAQFIFEASVTEPGETEFNRQRLFMRRINNIMKHTNKTLIIVSHTGKSGGRDAKQGVDRIIGSSAIAQVSTKVIEINRDKDGIQGIRLWKTRFTPYRYTGIQVRLDNMRVRSVYEPEEISMAREAWTGGAICHT